MSLPKYSINQAFYANFLLVRHFFILNEYLMFIKIQGKLVKSTIFNSFNVRSMLTQIL
jgi:hypothetical protein